MSRTEPAFSIALEKLTDLEPAYRLTREFLGKVFDEMENLSSVEIDRWLRDTTEDSWTYDYDPSPGESFDDFFQLMRQQLTIPDRPKLKITPNHRLFQIAGLSRLYLLEQSHDWGGSESWYYVDTGSVFSLTPLSGAYII